MKYAKYLASFFALALCLAILPAPAQAASAPDVSLYDTGSVTSYEYRIGVHMNSTLSVDNDDYNLSVCVSPYNAAVTDDAIDGWFLNIMFNDGTTNKTVANFTLDSEAANDVWHSADINLQDFVANDTADYWIVLIDDTYGTENDTAAGNLELYATVAIGTINAFIPIFVTFAVVGAIVGVVKKFKK